MSRPNRIAKFRTASGMSQAFVADRLGVSERTVDRWEKGQNRPDDETKIALADLFGGVSIPYLMGWEDGHNGNGDGYRQEQAA